MHLDVNDCGFPLSAVLTSASVHDSQVAIPLMKLTASKVTSCYDLMDAAYDASQICRITSYNVCYTKLLRPEFIYETSDDIPI